MPQQFRIRHSGLVIVLLIAAINCGCDHEQNPPAESKTASPSSADDSGEQSGHGYLGVTFEDIESSALTISGFVPGTDAESGGLQKGDTILRVERVYDPNYGDLNQIVERLSPGDAVGIRIARDDEELEYRVRLVSRDFIQRAMERHGP